jgi:hypothetical protein
MEAAMSDRLHSAAAIVRVALAVLILAGVAHITERVVHGAAQCRRTHCIRDDGPPPGMLPW